MAERLTAKFGYRNRMEVPRLEKVTVNMGVGDAKQTSSVLEAATEQLGVISGQRPNVRRARKSIASFKVRAGMPVGVAVTLRGARMWEFVDRLISIAIPRIRDFRGLNPRSFDGRGNYSLGLREQLIFPEIDYDSIDEVRGLDVTITTSASSDEEAFEMLLALGFPFSAEGRPGEVDHEAEEEERRREEARKRAEAEAAALEQLKEENPEAYEKRVRDRGRGGRRRRGRAERFRGPEVRGRRRPSRALPRNKRWPRLHRVVRQQRKPKYKSRGYSRCRRCGRSRAYYRKFGLCRLCLRELAHKGYIPGMTKSSW